MLTNRYHHHIDKLVHLKDKLSFIYGHLVLQAIALSMIGVFVPIYLYTIGFELEKIFLFLFVQWVVFGGFSPLLARLINRIGIKEVIAIRTPLLIFNFYFLYILPHNALLQRYIYLIAILEGVSSSLYTISITSLFAEHVGTKKQGQHTAKFLAFPRIASILAPALGGYIALTAGFPMLFLIVTILIFSSLIPILLIKENLNHPPYTSVAFNKFDTKEFVALVGYGMRDIALGLMLPLALYFYKSNSFSLGIIFSLTSLAGSILLIYLGKKMNLFGLKNLLHFGGIYTAALFIAMGYLFDSYWIIILAVLFGFNTVYVAYETRLYQLARTYRSPLEFIAFKEFSIFVGRTLYFIFLFLVTSGFDSAFYLGALASIVFIFY